MGNSFAKWVLKDDSRDDDCEEYQKENIPPYAEISDDLTTPNESFFELMEELNYVTKEVANNDDIGAIEEQTTDSFENGTPPVQNTELSDFIPPLHSHSTPNISYEDNLSRSSSSASSVVASQDYLTFKHHIKNNLRRTSGKLDISKGKVQRFYEDAEPLAGPSGLCRQSNDICTIQYIEPQPGPSGQHLDKSDDQEMYVLPRASELFKMKEYSLWDTSNSFWPSFTPTNVDYTPVRSKIFGSESSLFSITQEGAKADMSLEQQGLVSPTYWSKVDNSPFPRLVASVPSSPSRACYAHRRSLTF